MIRRTRSSAIRPRLAEGRVFQVPVDTDIEGALPVALAPECLIERGRGTTGNRLGSVSR